MRHHASAIAIICSLGMGLAGCGVVPGTSTVTTSTPSAPITAAEVQSFAVSACGYLPTFESASALIQADTTVAGSQTALTNAQYTQLAEQLAGLACTVAKASVASSAPAATTPAAATVTASAVRKLRRRYGALSVTGGVAYIGSPPVAVQITGSFQ